MAAAVKSQAKAKAKVEKDLIEATSAEIEKLTKVKALNLAKKIVEDSGFEDFRLGGVLSVIQANDYWVGAKNPDGEEYKSLREYMECEFNMQYRKGMYMIGIYNALVESGVAWEEVKTVGWTKLKEIAPLINKDNVAEWVERAENMTVVALGSYIKELGSASNASDGGGGGEEPSEPDSGIDDTTKVTSMTFKVHPDQKETIDQALDTAMKDNKTDYSSVALEYICMQYLEGKLGKPQKVPSLKAQMQKASDEELFGLIEERFSNYDISMTATE